MSVTRWLIGLTVLYACNAGAQIHLMPDKARREALEKEARIERMVMVPMRDGVRLASRIYIPKDAAGPVPAIFWRSHSPVCRRSPRNIAASACPQPSKTPRHCNASSFRKKAAKGNPHW